MNSRIGATDMALSRYSGNFLAMSTTRTANRLRCSSDTTLQVLTEGSLRGRPISRSSGGQVPGKDARTISMVSPLRSCLTRAKALPSSAADCHRPTSGCCRYQEQLAVDPVQNISGLITQSRQDRTVVGNQQRRQRIYIGTQFTFDRASKSTTKQQRVTVVRVQ